MTTEDLIKSLLTILHAFGEISVQTFCFILFLNWKGSSLLRDVFWSAHIWIFSFELVFWDRARQCGSVCQLMGLCYNDQHNLTIWPSPIYQCSVLWPAIGAVSKAFITAQYAVMKHLLYCLLSFCCFGWSFKSMVSIKIDFCVGIQIHSLLLGYPVVLASFCFCKIISFSPWIVLTVLLAVWL